MLDRPQQGANAHFEDGKFGVLTIGRSESMNALLKHARRYPICSLIEHKRKVQASHFHRKLALTDTQESELTLEVCTTVEFARRKTHSLEVIPIRMYEFQVNSLVFQDKVTIFAVECTCREYQASGIPCPHVIQTIDFCNWNVQDFCDDQFSMTKYKKAYNGPIYPTLDHSQ